MLLEIGALLTRTEAWTICVQAAGGTVSRRVLFRSAAFRLHREHKWLGRDGGPERGARAGLAVSPAMSEAHQAHGRMDGDQSLDETALRAGARESTLASQTCAKCHKAVDS